MNNLCEGYKASLKEALRHTREVFALEDGCLPKDVKPFHPSEFELNVKQKELF